MNNIEADHSQNSFFVITECFIDFVDLIFVNFVLERCFDRQDKSILSSGLNYSTACEFKGVQLDVVSDEIMA